MCTLSPQGDLRVLSTGTPLATCPASWEGDCPLHLLSRWLHGPRVKPASSSTSSCGSGRGNGVAAEHCSWEGVGSGLSSCCVTSCRVGIARLLGTGYGLNAPVGSLAALRFVL